MKKFRCLVVSFAVLFSFIFCFGAAVQAAGLEEQVSLKGPVPFANPTACTGSVVGRSSIEHKDLDLAQTIVGEVLNKDKSDDSLTITVRFRNGPPNTQMFVIWRALSTPGDCDTPVGGTFIGTITTDADGQARERYRLPDGNPFPGMGVKLVVCIPSAGCQPGDSVYTSLYQNAFAP